MCGGALSCWADEGGRESEERQKGQARPVPCGVMVAGAGTQSRKGCSPVPSSRSIGRVHGGRWTPLQGSEWAALLTLSSLVCAPAPTPLPARPPARDPTDPPLVHRDSSRQPAFRGAQRCRGHLCGGLAQPDSRARACPSKCLPTSAPVCPPCLGQHMKNPEERPQDGPGHRRPVGEAEAASQEVTGWGLLLAGGV